MSRPAVASVSATDVPDDVVMVDVREDDEWLAGHAPSAVHLPLSELVQRVDELPPGPLTLVCRVGSRSAQAAAWLAATQGRDVTNVEGGMQVWAAAGRPLVSETGLPPRVL